MSSAKSNLFFYASLFSFSKFSYYFFISFSCASPLPLVLTTGFQGVIAFAHTAVRGQLKTGLWATIVLDNGIGDRSKAIPRLFLRKGAGYPKYAISRLSSGLLRSPVSPDNGLVAPCSLIALRRIASELKGFDTPELIRVSKCVQTSRRVIMIICLLRHLRVRAGNNRLLCRASPCRKCERSPLCAGVSPVVPM